MLAPTGTICAIVVLITNSGLEGETLAELSFFVILSFPPVEFWESMLERKLHLMNNYSPEIIY